jgi:transcriptional regulator with XRE-family HTH domain
MFKMDLVEKVAKNLRKYRKGLSLAKLAQKADVPVKTIETIYYKQRIRDIQVSTLQKIASALGVSVDELLK